MMVGASLFVSSPTMHPSSKYLLVLLFVCFGSVALAEEPMPYGVISYDFLSIFDRSKPFVLFSTKMGAQLLRNNMTCYDNEGSVYSPSETNIRYMKASVQDNYLAWVNERDQICTKNLFHR